MAEDMLCMQKVHVLTKHLEEKRISGSGQEMIYLRSLLFRVDSAGLAGPIICLNTRQFHMFQAAIQCTVIWE